MKWYSVKKHKIPANIGFLFVALEVEELCSYAIAIYKHDIITDQFSWFHENGNKLSQVTHFCIPDPIEIEEDNCVHVAPPRPWPLTMCSKPVHSPEEPKEE